MNYIVMELIDGLTLKQYMQRRGDPLNGVRRSTFITQIMRALSHDHGRGIITGIFKPHTTSWSFGRSVKVTDFGIAHWPAAAQEHHDTGGHRSCTIFHEQAKGSHVGLPYRHLLRQALVLYEMLTGRLPFEGDTPVAVAIQHIKSIPVPPCDLNPEVPRALEAITMKAMAPELNQLMESAERCWMI